MSEANWAAARDRILKGAKGISFDSFETFGTMRNLVKRQGYTVSGSDPYKTAPYDKKAKEKEKELAVWPLTYAENVVKGREPYKRNLLKLKFHDGGERRRARARSARPLATPHSLCPRRRLPDFLTAATYICCVRARLDRGRDRGSHQALLHQGEGVGRRQPDRQVRGR